MSSTSENVKRTQRILGRSDDAFKSGDIVVPRYHFISFPTLYLSKLRRHYVSLIRGHAVCFGEIRISPAPVYYLNNEISYALSG